MSDLVTGDAVVLELRPAGVATRGLAFALDVLLQVVVLAVLLLLLPSGLFDTSLSTALTLVLVVCVVVGYPVVSEALTRGRTLGKVVLGLRVVRDDGGPVRFRHALVRGLTGFFVDFWALGLGGAVALVVALVSRRGQRVGDFLAGTVVIRERVPASVEPVVWVPPELAGWASGLDLSRLPDDLALSVRQYLGRVGDLSGDARWSLGRALADEVGRAVGAPCPPHVPLERYLSAVLAERRARQSRAAVPVAPVAAPDNPFAPPA
ncbi:RDD family protein [Saccharothrix syringae]|nr:RDD family protein [Saccharothrix syringae]